MLQIRRVTSEQCFRALHITLTTSSSSSFPSPHLNSWQQHPPPSSAHPGGEVTPGGRTVTPGPQPPPRGEEAWAHCLPLMPKPDTFVHGVQTPEDDQHIFPELHKMRKYRFLHPFSQYIPLRSSLSGRWFFTFVFPLLFSFTPYPYHRQHKQEQIVVHCLENGIRSELF